MANWRTVLSGFYNSFSIPAYPEASVPKDTPFPWATYSMGRNDFDDDTAEVLHLHYHTTSEAAPNAKADEICNAIRGGLCLKCDEGAMLLFPGSPEWITVNDETDNEHKHKVINITITWLLKR